MVHDYVELAGAAINSFFCFLQLRIGVVCAFVEAYNTGYDDGRSFEILDAAGDIW
jgi:hypothetical protein